MEKTCRVVCARIVAKGVCDSDMCAGTGRKTSAAIASESQLILV